MYLEHFGLTRHPFAKTIAPDELFPSAAAPEIDARLDHWLDLRSIALITGEPGSGKTTLCRKFADKLHPGLHRVFYIHHSTGNPTDLYKLIAWELRINVERNRAALFRSIRNEISRLVQESRIVPVVIIDEAHNLRNDVLEDLRLLTNFAMDSENRLALLLIGQSELRRRISMHIHDAFSQRIIVRHHIEGLGRDDFDAYISHLLRRAGTELPLFEAPALEAIFQATRGLPREINRTAHNALIAAAVARKKQVGIEQAETAIEESR